MDKQTKATSGKVIRRIVPLLAMWSLNRFLDTPKVKSALQEVDSRSYINKRKAARSVRRAGRNAASNPAWLAAGAAAIAVGIGLMAKAARGK
ncbi:MAG: hypothetical protein M3041_02045 [Acidobacteriota bacterium]|nr:hypothetical protein [Acidobacteriota bacterium]